MTADSEPKEQYLTVEETAKFLNVSVIYVNTLLEEGILECDDATIPMSELVKYKKHLTEESKKMLSALANESQKLKLGY